MIQTTFDRCRSAWYAAIVSSVFSGALPAQSEQGPRGDPDAAWSQNAKQRHDAEQQAIKAAADAKREAVEKTAPKPVQSRPMTLADLLLPQHAETLQEILQFQQSSPLQASSLVAYLLAQPLNQAHSAQVDLIGMMGRSRSSREALMNKTMAGVSTPTASGKASSPTVEGDSNSKPSGEQAQPDPKKAPEAPSDSVGTPVTQAPQEPASVGDTSLSAATLPPHPTENQLPKPAPEKTDPQKAKKRNTEAPQNTAPTTASTEVQDNGSGITGQLKNLKFSDLQKAQLETILQDDAGTDDIQVNARKDGMYDIYTNGKDGNARYYRVGQFPDGDIHVLRAYKDTDYMNANLKVSTPSLGAQKNTGTGKFEGKSMIGVGAGYTVGEHGAAGWIVGQDGGAWKANYDGKLLEVRAGVSAGHKGVSAGASIDGPGASVAGSRYYIPYCEDGQFKTHEFGGGVSGGAGLYKFGIKDGKVEMKVMGLGVSITGRTVPLTVDKLDPVTKGRLEALCPPVR